MVWTLLPLVAGAPTCLPQGSDCPRLMFTCRQKAASGFHFVLGGGPVFQELWPECPPSVDDIKISSIAQITLETLLSVLFSFSDPRGTHLWEFIRDILLNPEKNPGLIKWEDRSEGVFRFLKSEAVAQLWGKKKNNSSMTYEKLSRAMR